MRIDHINRFGSHHTEILNLLKKNDVASAQTALKKHLTAVKDAVIQGMGNQAETDLDLDWHA